MSNLGKDFYPKLVQISSEVGMSPEDLIAVMISESGMKSDASNPNGGATGLIQFMPNTLKSLKYQGTSNDFGKLQGQEQLDWIKKYIVNQTKMNGGPFTSAAQYYVANFFPVALKLPGIRKGDPSTIFVEENPKTVNVDGKIYSKKYYDVGIKLHPKSEISAYKANPGFHGTVPGAITYADMIKIIERNKKNPLYSKALLALTDTTNYVPQNKEILQMPRQFYATNKSKSNSSNTSSNSVALTLDNLLKNVANKQDLNLIKISSFNPIFSLEFARIAKLALKEEYNISSQVYLDNDVYIKCTGKSLLINSLLIGLKSGFKQATLKIGGIDVDLSNEDKLIDKPISDKVACSYYRRFLLKFC